MRATRHLRAGGAVVVLIDSASAAAPGRRAVPFMDGAIAAPDAVIAWAVRNQAALWAAVAEGNGYRLHVLRDAGSPEDASQDVVEEVSDRGIALFREAIVRRPEQWAWIRPLVSLLLGVGLALSSCTPIEVVPPLPVEPSKWTAQASGVEWSGALRGGINASLKAESMEGRWLNSAADGHFVDVKIVLRRGDESAPSGEIHAAEGLGRWPQGPFVLRKANWRLTGGLFPELSKEQLRGTEPEIGWTEAGRLRCGGCALERIERHSGAERNDDGEQSL